MAAAVAARTSRVTIGTAVLLLPLHDPIRVAEDAAVVDVLSDGRLRLGLGLGYKLEEFEAFGVDRRARPSLLEEGIEIIRGAWADGPFSHHGRHRQLRRPRCHAQAGAAPGTADLAGRPGAGPRRPRRDDRRRPRSSSAGPTSTASTTTPIGPAGGSTRRACASSPSRTRATTPSAPTSELSQYAMYRMENYAQWYGNAGDLATDRALLQTAGAADAGGAMQLLRDRPAR